MIKIPILFLLTLCLTFLAYGETNIANVKGLNYKRIKNEYIVYFKDEITTGEIQKVFQKLDLNKVQNLPLIDAYLVKLTDKKRKRLSKENSIKLIEANIILNSASFNKGLDRINQPTLPLDGDHSHGMPANGAVIYMIDSGVNFEHEQLKGRVSYLYDYQLGNNGNDCNGHGTHTAGIIADTAKYAQLKVLRTLDCSGSTSASIIVTAMNVIASQGIPNSVVYLGIESGAASSAVDSATTNLINMGYHVVTPAGNSGINVANASPARVPQTISVSSLSSNDGLSSFNNYGAIDMCAPGENIESADNKSLTGFTSKSGTSQAAALVAASLAGYLTKGYRVEQFFSMAISGPNCLIPILSLPNPPATPDIDIIQKGQAGFSVGWYNTAYTPTTTDGSPSYYQLQENNNGQGWGASERKETTSELKGSYFPGTYYYRVKACNVSGCSNWSISKSITIVSSLQQCPANL